MQTGNLSSQVEKERILIIVRRELGGAQYGLGRCDTRDSLPEIQGFDVTFNEERTPFGPFIRLGCVTVAEC